VAEALFDSPIGPLYAVATSGGLQRLEFVRHASRMEPSGASNGWADPEGHDVLEETKRQLQEYFDGARREFHLPIEPSGSDFQMRVWQAIASIPYGQVLSYAEVAIAAGSPGAFRAAGSACGVNRIAIVIPCHRVVASNRGIGGYGGGMEIKTALLKLEGSLEGLKGAKGALAFA
jgi:methylated-DNA-[protein]-cysteine S-methyltransferase